MLEEVAWFEENSGDFAHPVKNLKKNDFNLFDMSGNVWEWCSTIYEDGKSRIIKGGSWYSSSDYCKLTSRDKSKPCKSYSFIGFRIAKSFKFEKK